MADEILSQAEIEALMAGAASGQTSEPDASSSSQPEGAEASADPGAGASPVIEVVAPAEAPQQRPNPPISMHQSVSQPVRTAQFAPLSRSDDPGTRTAVDLILDVRVQVAVELGQTTMQVREVLGLGPGSVVELDKHAGEPVEVVVNNKTVARGEVVVIDENFGVRITEIVDAKGREVDLQAA